MVEFSFQGGRGGVISGKIDGRTGHMEWEMLIGEVNFVIYRGSGCWPGKEEVKMSELEEARFLEEFASWAKPKKFNYEVD